MTRQEFSIKSRDKTCQDMTRQDKTRQDKTRQDKTRQDKNSLLRATLGEKCEFLLFLVYLWFMMSSV